MWNTIASLLFDLNYKFELIGASFLALAKSIYYYYTPALTDHTVTKVKRDPLSLPVRMGGLGFTDPVVTSSSEYEASIKVTDPLEQQHQPPDTSEIQTLQLSARKQKDDRLSERLEQVKNSLPTKAKRAVELATEKGSSNWLTVIPLKELDYNLNKKEFRDAMTGK